MSTIALFYFYFIIIFRIKLFIGEPLLRDTELTITLYIIKMLYKTIIIQIYNTKRCYNRATLFVSIKMLIMTILSFFL